LEWWIAVLGGAATGLLFKAVYLALEDIEVKFKDETK
jgi:hypothetical protein